MRESLLTNDMSKCLICGKPKDHIHEVYFGAFRQKSIQYKCCVPLCLKHHIGPEGPHQNRKIDLDLKKRMQKAFIQEYSQEKFMEVFKKNYL